ncbi:MAG: CopG family ribbon-helix-helix protein [Burkholderiales bacterium]
MPATSLKLPDDLKKRIDTLVAQRDQTAHAFMVEAIRRETERAELRRQFMDEAKAAHTEVLRGGNAYEAAEVFDYLEARVQGKKTRKPRAKKWPPSA